MIGGWYTPTPARTRALSCTLTCPSHLCAGYILALDMTARDIQSIAKGKVSVGDVYS
jgi:hypothetical protein